MKRQQKLFLEERIAIAYRMLNEDSVALPLEHKAVKAFILQVMGVLNGDLDAVPERMRKSRPRLII